MLNPRDAQKLPPWIDTDSDWDDDMSDTGVLPDGADFAEESDFYDDAPGTASLAAWQRVEIARENRKLRSMLNDLDDYPDFEYPDDAYSSEYSY